MTDEGELSQQFEEGRKYGAASLESTLILSQSHTAWAEGLF